MHADEAARRAWQAFEEGRLEDADRMWSDLIASAEDEEARDRFAGHRAYVHVAQRRFDEARAVYRDLLERRRSHRYLHQLGMVEREAGNLAEARRIFDREAGQLPADDALARAANLYERALVRHLLQEPAPAIELMERCVEAAARCDSLTMVAVSYRLKGDVLAGQDPSRAKKAYGEALDYFAQAEDDIGMAEVTHRIASLSAP